MKEPGMDLLDDSGDEGGGGASASKTIDGEMDENLLLYSDDEESGPRTHQSQHYGGTSYDEEQLLYEGDDDEEYLGDMTNDGDVLDLALGEEELESPDGVGSSHINPVKVRATADSTVESDEQRQGQAAISSSDDKALDSPPASVASTGKSAPDSDDEDEDSRHRSRFWSERKTEEITKSSNSSSAEGNPIQTLGERNQRPAHMVDSRRGARGGGRGGMMRFQPRGMMHQGMRPRPQSLLGDHPRQPLLRFPGGYAGENLQQLQGGFIDFSKPLRPPPKNNNSPAKNQEASKCPPQVPSQAPQQRQGPPRQMRPLRPVQNRPVRPRGPQVNPFIPGPPVVMQGPPRPLMNPRPPLRPAQFHWNQPQQAGIPIVITPVGPLENGPFHHNNNNNFGGPPGLMGPPPGGPQQHFGPPNGFIRQPFHPRFPQPDQHRPPELMRMPHPHFGHNFPHEHHNMFRPELRMPMMQQQQRFGPPEHQQQQQQQPPPMHQHPQQQQQNWGPQHDPFQRPLPQQHQQQQQQQHAPQEKINPFRAPEVPQQQQQQQHERPSPFYPDRYREERDDEYRSSSSDRYRDRADRDRDYYERDSRSSKDYRESDRYESERYESDRYESDRYESDRYESDRSYERSSHARPPLKRPGDYREEHWQEKRALPSPEKRLGGRLGPPVIQGGNVQEFHKRNEVMKSTEDAKKAIGLDDDYLRKLEEQKEMRARILREKEQRRKQQQTGQGQGSGQPEDSPVKEIPPANREVRLVKGQESSSLSSSSAAAVPSKSIYINPRAFRGDLSALKSSGGMSTTTTSIAGSGTKAVVKTVSSGPVQKIEANQAGGFGGGGGSQKKRTILRIVRNKKGEIISKSKVIVLPKGSLSSSSTGSTTTTTSTSLQSIKSIK